MKRLWIGTMIGALASCASGEAPEYVSGQVGAGAQHVEATTEQCYLVSDSIDVLTIVDKEDPNPASNEVTVGPLGAADVEAIAVDPITRVLLGADAGQLGRIDVDTGSFVALPRAVGSGDGALGTLAFDDVDGLSFDPTTGALFGTVRRPAPETDLLIRIDKRTGEHVADAFGAGVDYLEIPGVAGNPDVDDLAIDIDGTMYAIANAGGQGDHLITIDKATAEPTDIGPTVVDDIEGLGFDTSGQLWGSAGTSRQLYRLDKATGAATIAVPINNGNDYEGIDCLIDEDPDGDGIPTLGETIIGTDPLDADSDDDCIIDGAEPDFESDSDGDGMINPLDPDSDNDGIFDGTEVGTTEAHPDSDLGAGVCVFDADPTTTTDPLDPDSDDGGELDGDEDANHDGRVDEGESDPNQAGDDDDDRDGDGIPNVEDNCPDVANPDQGDADGDAIGDRCDSDPGLDFSVTGGGCAAGGGDVGWLALLAMALFALGLRGRRAQRRRWRRPFELAVAACAVSAVAAPANAQISEQFTLERFRISLDREGVLDLEWGATLGHLRWDLGLWMGAADDPLVVIVRDAGDSERIGELVGRRIGGHLVGTIGLRSWLQAGVELPLIVNQAQDIGMSPFGGMGGGIGSFGLGDLRFLPKVQFLRSDEHYVSAALIPAFTLSTSTSSDFFGEGGLTFAPELAVSRAFGPIRVATNVGYRARKPKMLGDLTIDDEVFWRIGAGYRFRDAGGPPVELDLTMSTATKAADFLQNANNNHIELLGAVQYLFAEPLLGFAAAGFGLNEGFGTPDARVLIGLRFGGVVPRRREPQRLPEPEPEPEPAPSCDRAVDPDCDGVQGEQDWCPDAPGTPQGFGCPDPRAEFEPCDRIDVQPRVAFAPAEMTLVPSARLALDELARVLSEEQKGALVVIEVGDATTDRGLTQARADALVAYLVEKGVNPARLAGKGLGAAATGGADVGDRVVSAAPPDGAVREPDTSAAGAIAFRLVCPGEEPPLCKGDKLELSGKIEFAVNSDVINEASKQWLESEVVWRLRAHAEAKVTIEGHTSSEGKREYNIGLSKRRAAAVLSYLVENGIAPERLKSAGFGPDRPIADNQTEDGRSQNRRIEFQVTQGETGCPAPPLPPCAKLDVGKIHFRVNTAAIVRQSSFRELAKVVKTLADNPEMRIRIEGHTSSEGKYERNKVLSQQRAEAVRDYLIKRGVAAERLEVVGFGPDRLAIDPEQSEKDREENRRVEFTVISQGACVAD